MRAHALLVLLAACRAVPEATHAPAPPSDVALLVGDAEGRPHAWVARGDRIRWRVDGPLVSRPAPFTIPRAYAVVDEDAATVRVLVAESGVRLLAWVDEADLHDVITRDTDVDIDGAIGGAGATLFVGAAVKINGCDGDRCAVRTVLSGVEVAGSVPAAVLGRRFAPGPVDDDQPAGWLPSGTAIRAAPRSDAPVIAVVHEHSVRALGPPVSGWQEVEVIGDVARAHGYAAGEVRDGDMNIYGGLLGEEDGDAAAALVAVDAGACVYDRPGGVPVGIVTEASERSLRSAAPGWWTTTIALGGGKVDVALEGAPAHWGRCPGVRP